MKIGSSSIVTHSGEFDGNRAQLLVDDIIRLREEGKVVYLVSSGAVALGRKGDLKLDRKTAAAAGQSELIQYWKIWFSSRAHIRICAALLADGSEFEVPARNDTLWIINGNDVVSSVNNDLLAAAVANKVKADALFLLTDVDGYLDIEKKRIDLMKVDSIDLSRHDENGSSFGTGGIQTKLQAIREAQTRFSVIASSSKVAAMSRILRGEDIGTCFLR